MASNKEAANPFTASKTEMFAMHEYIDFEMGQREERGNSFFKIEWV